MSRYFLIFHQICIFCYQFEPILTDLHVICCWHAVFELEKLENFTKKSKIWRNSSKIDQNFRFSKVEMFR